MQQDASRTVPLEPNGARRRNTFSRASDTM